MNLLMGESSAIAWTDHTWNCWVGCKKTSTGCINCYMFRDQRRYGNDPKLIRRTSDRTFNLPNRLKDTKANKVFVCSWSDFFLSEADQWRDEAWAMIRKNPHLIFQILTKRPELMPERMPSDWGEGWPNVWLGVSVENEDYVGRVLELFKISSQTYWVSHEPALEYVNFTRIAGDNRIVNALDGREWIMGPDLKLHRSRTTAKYLRWIVSGGESGEEHRSPKIEVFEHQLEDARTYGIAFYMKQLGGFPYAKDKMEDFPEHLQVREFPYEIPPAQENLF